MDPLSFLLRLVALAATVVFLAATALMLLTFRRARRVSRTSLLVPVVVSLVVLALYCLVLGATPSAGWWVLGLGGGAIVGALWARSHRLFRVGDGGVRSRANLWYLAVWAGVLAVNQLVVTVSDRSSRVLVGLLLFSTGIALGNGLALMLRLRRLRIATTLAFGLAALGAVAGAEDVLLLLPRDFDVRPIGGRGVQGTDQRRFTAKEFENDPPFRFRGEDVTQEQSRVDHHQGADCSVDIQYHHEYRAKFRRGVLTGRWLTHQRNFYRACPGRAGEYMRVNHEATVTGQANADGRLEAKVQVIASEILDHEEGGWVRRNQHVEPWSFVLEFQLPVGELQSSQKLSPRPTPVPALRAGATGHRDNAVQRGAAGGSAPEPTPERGTGPEGADAPAGTPDADAGSEESPPVSPAAAAGAATGAAAVSLLGAIWMLISSGVRPTELLSPPPVDLEAPPAAGLPAAEVPVVHQDGDVHPGTGDVWSAFDRGWIGADQYAREHGAWQDEVARAQQVSKDEEQQRAAASADAWRASEARRREAAAAQAGAAREFEIEASFRPEKIEPYQPEWSDRVTQGLEWAEWGADSGVSLLGEMTGEFGKLWGRVYTLGKETVKGASEGVAAYARGKGGVLAEEGSAWVIAERAGIGLAKGGAKVGLDAAAGKLMEGVARLGGRSIPELPDLGDATLVDVVGQVASGAAGGATRQAVGIAVGKTAGSQVVQAPVGYGVKAATGESL